MMKLRYTCLVRIYLSSRGYKVFDNRDATFCGDSIDDTTEAFGQCSEKCLDR